MFHSIRKTNLRKKRRKIKKKVKNILVINGSEVGLRRVDGYNIMEKDADALEALHQKLVQQGESEANIEHRMKLARRKAEKALAREKRKICFNCHKSGHHVANCPETDKVKPLDVQSFCYKCGSKTHSHKQCTEVTGDHYGFAKCFVCGEQGHLARQCSKNLHGVYRYGGACHNCGEKTHLAKNCQKKKETATPYHAKKRKKNVEYHDEEGSIEQKPTSKRKLVKF